MNLLTRRPEAWSKTVTCELQSPSKKRSMVDFGSVKHPAAEVLQTVTGEINKKSSDPSDVVPEAVSVNDAVMQRTMGVFCQILMNYYDTHTGCNSAVYASTSIPRCP